MSAPATTKAAVRNGRTRASAPPPCPASAGATSIIGTTQRSWKSRIPTMSLPCGASTSPRSASPLRTIAVLESAIRKPTKMPFGAEVPARTARTATTAVVSPTWRLPPTERMRPRRRSSSRENSRPMVKSRSATPTSASRSTWCGSRTAPRPPGPSSAPATMKPAMVGSRRRLRTSTTASAAAKITTRSRRRPRSCMPPLP